MALLDDLVPDRSDDSSGRRRYLLLLVLLLVVLGAGVGTFAFTEPEDLEPGIQTPVPTATQSPTPPDRLVNVSLSFPNGATLLEARGVVPGETGESRLTVANVGSTTGRLAITSLSVSDAENGLTGAESGIDDSTETGELSDAIRVRLTVRYPDGDAVVVYGTEDAFTTLGDIRARNETLGDGLEPDQAATFVLEWRVERDAGNAIQSDGTTVSLRLRLQQLVTATG